MKMFTPQKNHLMTTGSIPQHIIQFAVPLIAGNLLQQSYQLIDMIIVGRCIDDNGLSIAAVGMSSSFIMLMIGFFMGLSTGAGIVISNAYGAGQIGKVKKSVKLSLVLAAAVSVVIAAASITCCEWLLTIFHTTEDIFDLAAAYLKLYAAGFIPSLIYNMGTSVLQAFGNSTSPFYYLAGTCLLNVILDYLFMGPGDMGVEGAAAATVLSQILAMILTLAKIYGTYTSLKKEKEEDENGWKLLQTILKYSLPISFQQIAATLSNLILQGYINLLGTGTIAAWGIFGKIDGFLLMPLRGFSLAMTTFAGQNMGAGNVKRVMEGKRWVSWMSCGITVCMSLIFLSLCEPIICIFEDEPDIVNAAKEMCWYMLPFYFLLALMRVYSGLFNGMGKTFYSSVVLFSCLCIVRVAAVAVLFPVMESAYAVYLSFYASWISALGLFLIRYPALRKENGL